jgi:ketosteroid isomerase-like protein
MGRRGAVLGTVLVLVAGSSAFSDRAEPLEALAEQVRNQETAFAKTMADRDITAFAMFVSEEAVFLGSTALRGRDAVIEGWKPFFESPEAPFSWDPERVEVVASGTIAISTGPVRDPDGQRVGTFTSTWRREPDGHWRVVLDSGCPPCHCADSSPQAAGE